MSLAHRTTVDEMDVQVRAGRRTAVADEPEVLALVDEDRLVLDRRVIGVDWRLGGAQAGRHRVSA